MNARFNTHVSISVLNERIEDKTNSVAFSSRSSEMTMFAPWANYIVKLPKAEQQATPWQAAAEVLMLIGEHGLR
jgi:hypothetical protein